MFQEPRDFGLVNSDHPSGDRLRVKIFCGGPLARPGAFAPWSRLREKLFDAEHLSGSVHVKRSEMTSYTFLMTKGDVMSYSQVQQTKRSGTSSEQQI
ncbi:hypothetical protein DESC_190046 [Desulfosarcina cetonica]|nr:hypothetical protein DESC_190046 [Desulfosarcina cetonica]